MSGVNGSPKRMGILLLLAAAVFLFIPDTSAFAADGGALAWREPLQKLSDNLTNSAVPAILSIMIAVSGIMVLFGEQNQFKPFFNIVLGTALAAQITLGLTTLGFGSLLHPAAVTTLTPASMDSIKITDDVASFNPLSGFMKVFIHVIDNGSQVLVAYALELAGFLIVIDLTVSLALGLVNEDKVRYLLVQVLKIGFFVFLIENWVGGTYQLTHAVMASFEKLGFLASGMGETYLPDSIVQNGMKSFSIIWENISHLGISSLGALIGNLIVAFVVVITTFLTGIEMFLARIEFWTISLITIILLPFGLNKHTSFLAEKAIGAIFSLGIKIAVIAFLTAVACPLLANFTEQIKAQAEAGEDLLELSAMLQLVLACIVLYLLVRRIPQLAQGLISGSPSLASGDFYDTAPSPFRAVSATAGFAGNTYGTYQMARNMEGGGNARKADGDTSWLSQASGTLANMSSIAWNRHNPFVSENRTAQQQIQHMMSAKANNDDIKRTARGDFDAYDKDGNLTPHAMYVATKNEGAVGTGNTPVVNGNGKRMTHGWTPAPRTDNQMDRDTNEKVNALYEKYHK